MPAWSPMALMVTIAFMVSCVSLILCPMLYPGAVCLPIMRICMHGLLCLPSLLRALIMLGLLLYMLGISCLPSLFGLLCLPGLLCFVLIRPVLAMVSQIYIYGLLWSSMDAWSSCVSCVLLCSYPMCAYGSLHGYACLVISLHGLCLPVLLVPWPYLVCCTFEFSLLCASLHGLLCLLCLILIF